MVRQWLVLMWIKVRKIADDNSSDTKIQFLTSKPFVDIHRAKFENSIAAQSHNCNIKPHVLHNNFAGEGHKYEQFKQIVCYSNKFWILVFWLREGVSTPGIYQLSIICRLLKTYISWWSPLHYQIYRRTLHIHSHSSLCWCCCRSPTKDTWCVDICILK